MKIGLEARRRRVVTVEVVPDRVNPSELSLLRGRVDAVAIPAVRNGPQDQSYPDEFHVSPQQRSIACALLVKRLGLESIATVTCRDTQAAKADEISGSGLPQRLENILAVYGDPCGSGQDVYEFSRTDELIRYVHYVSSNPGGVSVGATTNQYAKSREREIERTLARVDAGASFVVTNTVFDEELALNQRDGLLAAGLDVPLLFQVSIPHGLENLVYVSRKFGIPVPGRLARRLRDAPSSGVDFATETFESLNMEGSGIHFSSLLRKRDPVPVYSLLLDRIRPESVTLSVPTRIVQRSG